jgi:hypothetical protein
LEKLRVTALLCVLSFFLGVAFRQWLAWMDRPKVTPWGESTRYWSDTDWEWYRNRKNREDLLEDRSVGETK